MIDAKILMNTTSAIEKLFARVHRTIGDNQLCATGEPYTTYGIIASSPEKAAEMLLNTFRALVAGCAQVKPEGAPLYIADEKPRYLYWRRLPEIEGANDGGFAITCRAVVSLEWQDLGQLASERERKLDPQSLEAIALAIVNARSIDGKVVALMPTNALQPWLAEQMPKPFKAAE